MSDNALQEVNGERARARKRKGAGASAQTIVVVTGESGQVLGAQLCQSCSPMPDVVRSTWPVVLYNSLPTNLCVFD
jgi:hypothetical protein